MSMSVGAGLNINVIDSLNFLPMKLASLPQAFGLNELKKGYFPHFFNLDENQDDKNVYPDAKYYGVDYMSKGDRKEFYKWYETKKNEIFDFKTEMLEYCRSDVDILRKACIEFRSLVIKTSKIDPFQYKTIASVCMNIFKRMFLEERGIVNVTYKKEKMTDVPCKVKDDVWNVFIKDKWMSESAYGLKIHKDYYKFKSSDIGVASNRGKDVFSKISIQWLEYVQHVENVKIDHALNGGEKLIIVQGKKYKVDGFCHESNTVYEYHGCIYHGCTRCFPDTRNATKHPYTGQSMNELYALTQQKQLLLESAGYNYVCMWDCSFKRMLKDKTVHDFVTNVKWHDRLNARN